MKFFQYKLMWFFVLIVLIAVPLSVFTNWYLKNIGELHKIRKLREEWLANGINVEIIDGQITSAYFLVPTDKLPNDRIESLIRSESMTFVLLHPLDNDISIESFPNSDRRFTIAAEGTNLTKEGHKTLREKFPNAELFLRDSDE